MKEQRNFDLVMELRGILPVMTQDWFLIRRADGRFERHIVNIYPFISAELERFKITEIKEGDEIVACNTRIKERGKNGSTVS